MHIRYVMAGVKLIKRTRESWIILIIIELIRSCCYTRGATNDVTELEMKPFRRHFGGIRYVNNRVSEWVSRV